MDRNAKRDAPPLPSRDGDISGETVSPAEATFLRRVGDIVRVWSGLDIAPYKRRYTLRRIAVRERAVGAPSHDDYVALLERDSAEIPHLLEALTVNVTEFFRDAEVFEALRHRILPALVRETMPSPRRPFRVWSAGCASGEEAYSVAMMLEEIFAGCSFAADYRIVATDVDFRALATGESARYAEAKMRNVSPQRRAMFFEEVRRDGPRRDHSAWRVKEEIRERVRFGRHDLLEPFPDKDFDLVLCRNALMYFSAPLQEKMLALLADAVGPGGRLVLGQVERLIGPARRLFEPEEGALNIFRKRQA